MELINMLNELMQNIKDLQLKLENAQASLEAEVKAAYDKGFEEGKASVQVPPSDKIYSQAELDEALAPLKERIVQMEVELSGVDARINDAVFAMKQELFVKFQDLKAKEDIAELDFESFLK